MVTKKQNSYKLEKEFEDSIISFHYRLVSELRKKSKEFGLSLSQMEVLHFVVEKINPTMKDIAEHLQIKPPSATTIVETLCKMKLLKREISREDKRIIRISFTENIWKFFKSIKNKKFLILKSIFSTLADDDKLELIRIIKILNKK
ncbi:MAG: MarR family transcriptional regulator [bacterium]